MVLPEVVVKVVHLMVEAFLLSGSWARRIAESAKSSPNRRAFEAIMICSAKNYSTRFTMRGDGVYSKRVDMGFQNGTTSLLMYKRSTKGIIGEFKWDVGAYFAKGERRGC